jgi:hypothetical protein
MLGELDSLRLEELIKEGYADELETRAPSVIPFTTAVASYAISEFLHRLTGYMGEERVSNEVIILFDETRVRTNSRFSKPECFCGEDYYIGRGDTEPLLDLTRRPDELF